MSDRKRKILSWCIYDRANSGLAVTMLASTFFFITGGFLFLFSDHEKGKALAKEAEAKIEGMVR